MSPLTSNPQVDEVTAERESPVRRAHAAAASREGRASAPGYLGMPVQDGAGRDSDERDDAPEDDAGSSGGSRRAARTRGETNRSNGSGGGGQRRSAGSQSRGDAEKGRSSKPDSSAAKGRRGSSASKSGAKGRSSRPTKPTAGRAAGAGRRTGTKATRAAGKAAEKGAAGVARKVASAAGSGRDGVRRTAGKELRRIVRRVAKEALVMSADAAGKAMRQVGETGIEAVAERVNRLPIQRSVDVAVPVEVAWAQWMEFDHLPEGPIRVTDVERDGDTLYGRIDRVSHGDWEAEILDERENESFAWRSTQGSDSAGLVTFHELSERLTRIELELDVRPVHLMEAATLALHLADRRVDAELRRFKADAELISPDSYDDLLFGEEEDEDE